MANLQSIDDLPVYNATESLSLLIEDCDIEGATPQDESNCVAARALMRQHGAYEVRVHRSRVYVRFDHSRWFRYQTPPALRDEEIAFDRGGASFEGAARIITLPVLSQSARPSGRRQGSNSNGHSDRMRQPRRALTNVRPHA